MINVIKKKKERIKMQKIDILCRAKLIIKFIRTLCGYKND